jgi:hypothetical protein
MDISSEKPKDAKFVLHKIWCTLEKMFSRERCLLEESKGSIKINSINFYNIRIAQWNKF